MRRPRNVKACLAWEDAIVIEKMLEFMNTYTHPEAWRCIAGGSWAKPDNCRMPRPLMERLQARSSRLWKACWHRRRGTNINSRRVYIYLCVLSHDARLSDLIVMGLVLCENEVYGNRALFQKLIKRMRRVDESWERQTAPRIYIHTELG
eukprot:COSAG01_NODE_4633_length_4853_cov_6.538332_7_plen_149_part_00